MRTREYQYTGNRRPATSCLSIIREREFCSSASLSCMFSRHATERETELRIHRGRQQSPSDFLSLSRALQTELCTKAQSTGKNFGRQPTVMTSLRTDTSSTALVIGVYLRICTSTAGVSLSLLSHTCCQQRQSFVLTTYRTLRTTLVYQLFRSP
jgi:hypothetical protein